MTVTGRMTITSRVNITSRMTITGLTITSLLKCVFIKAVDFMPNFALVKSNTAGLPPFKEGHNSAQGVTACVFQADPIITLAIFNQSKEELLIQL